MIEAWKGSQRRGYDNRELTILDFAMVNDEKVGAEEGTAGECHVDRRDPLVGKPEASEDGDVVKLSHVGRGVGDNEKVHDFLRASGTRDHTDGGR